MLKVAFGVTAALQGEAGAGIDGIGIYTRELRAGLSLKEDIALHPFHYGAATTASEDVYPAGGFARQAAAALVLGRPFRSLESWATELDIVHATDHFVPKLVKTPVVATLMDAIPLSHPEWVNYSFKGLKNAMWRRSFMWADRIITISEYSKREITTYFDIPGEKIDVIPLGVDDSWFAKPTDDLLDCTRRTYELPESFIVCVGTLQPRKNLQTLIRAHENLPDDVRRALPLLVVGRPGWDCEEEIRSLNAADPQLMRWLQYVPDLQLRSIVHLATATVFPSLCEGFGLPVLESFAAGTPVIASNTTGLAETAGDAALLVDPSDPDSITEALQQIAQSPALARILAEKGRQRATEFTWQRTVEMTLAAYRRVL